MSATISHAHVAITPGRSLELDAALSRLLEALCLKISDSSFKAHNRPREHAEQVHEVAPHAANGIHVIKKFAADGELAPGLGVKFRPSGGLIHEDSSRCEACGHTPVTNVGATGRPGSDSGPDALHATP